MDSMKCLGEIIGNSVAKEIQGYGGKYAVTNCGFVWSCHTGNWKKARPRVGHRGHLRVALQFNGKREDKLVHRIVLEAFTGPCPDGMECCHNDGNPSNNCFENLRWDTRKSNSNDQHIHGTSQRGERHHKSRLTRNDVRVIRIRASNGTPMVELAREYGVTDGHICNVVRGHLWKHETEVPPVTESLVPRGSNHPMSKLTETQVVDIRKAIAAGEMQKIIAKRYNVSRSLICAINRGRTRSH